MVVPHARIAALWPLALVKQIKSRTVDGSKEQIYFRWTSQTNFDDTQW